jgi:hypothetical protein
LDHEDEACDQEPISLAEGVGDWINANAQPTNPDANRTVLAGSRGRPATRDELVAFVAEQNARYTREHGEE